MNLVIRLCTKSDIPSVRQLLVSTWHDTYDHSYGATRVSEITDRWHSVDALSQQLNRVNSLFLVVEENDRIIGTSKAEQNTASILKLDRLYVDPKVQSVGVGTAVLNYIFDAFPFAQQCDLEVEPNNQKAIRFYGKHGFERLNSTQNCGGSSDIPAVVMRKSLSKNAEGSPVMLRPVRDDDAQDLIGLITLCFAEYPGCVFDPHGDMPDIIQPIASKVARDGQFIVVEDARGRIAACIGIDFEDRETAELHRLYVRHDMRGQGLAKILTTKMETFAKSRGAKRMILWTDTRFTKAHHLYAKMGYQLVSVTRSLGDISVSREFFFEKTL